MSILKWFARFVVVSTVTTCLTAETRCPGNVTSLPFRPANRHQMIVPVSIDHHGPYRFLVDTGTQVTIVDPSLAAELHLSERGKAAVSSVGVTASASFAQVEVIEAGSHSAENQKVLVYNLKNLQAAGLDIQGVLGEDFLKQFDMLIDNAHNLICLDASGVMRASVKGPHIPLVPLEQTNDDVHNSLIILASLSDASRPVRLKLDSGANTSYLYDSSAYMPLGLLRGAAFQGGGGGQRTFSAFPPQTVKIGSVELTRILFVTTVGVQNDSSSGDLDGLLTTDLFRHVFIDHKERIVILDPW